MQRDVVKAAASVLRKARAPTPPGENRAFWQRSIVEFLIAEDEHGEFIAAMKLSCGHVLEAVRRRPSTSKRKTAPCYECGSGTRQQHDHRQARQRFEKALVRALEDEEQRQHAAEFLRCALVLCALKPGDLRGERLRAGMREAARLGGMLVALDDASKARP